MSVLIKGMEMPKSCGECLDVGWHYVFECNLDDVEQGERRTDCPLIHVPKHGRLIDADTLMEFPIRINHYDKKHGDEHFVLGIETVMEYIECAPTVIPADKDGGE